MNMVNLGDLTNIYTGKLDANASSENGEYPFFTCAREPLRISTYSYDCECVLIAGNGDLNAKYYQGKFDAYQRTYIVEAYPEIQDKLHLRYVYYFLEKYLVTLREQSIGGIIKYIKLGHLTDAKIPLPPLAEQKRIAGILDAADKLRARRRDSLAQLDTLLQSTFLELFGDPVTNPMWWDTANLGQLGEIITGNTPSRKHPEYYGEHIEWIKSDNINDPAFILTEAEERLSLAGKKVARMSPNGSILVTCIAGSPSCIGNAAIANREVSFNQQINAFVPGPRIALWFAFGVFWIGKRLVQRASTSSMKGMVSKSAFSAISIPLPPLDLQHRFAAIVESVEQQKASQRAHLAELDTLFAALQQRAFNGEL
jgi:type I restriction enzyme, S subunit